MATDEQERHNTERGLRLGSWNLHSSKKTEEMCMCRWRDNICKLGANEELVEARTLPTFDGVEALTNTAQTPSVRSDSARLRHQV